VFHQAAMRDGESNAVWDYEKDLKPELKHVIDLQQGKLKKWTNARLRCLRCMTEELDMNADLHGSEAWAPATEPVITFSLDNGRVIGFPFSHLVKAEYSTAGLVLHWPTDMVEITGPKALEFYKDFAKGNGTWVKADGTDIESVRLI
jgi:hypothetical protein